VEPKGGATAPGFGGGNMEDPDHSTYKWDLCGHGDINGGVGIGWGRGGWCGGGKVEPEVGGKRRRSRIGTRVFLKGAWARGLWMNKGGGETVCLQE